MSNVSNPDLDRCREILHRLVREAHSFVNDLNVPQGSADRFMEAIEARRDAIDRSPPDLKRYSSIGRAIHESDMEDCWIQSPQDWKNGFEEVSGIVVKARFNIDL